MGVGDVETCRPPAQRHGFQRLIGHESDTVEAGGCDTLLNDFDHGTRPEERSRPAPDFSAETQVEACKRQDLQRPIEVGDQNHDVVYRPTLLLIRRRHGDLGNTDFGSGPVPQPAVQAPADGGRTKRCRIVKAESMPGDRKAHSEKSHRDQDAMDAASAVPRPPTRLAQGAPVACSPALPQTRSMSDVGTLGQHRRPYEGGPGWVKMVAAVPATTLRGRWSLHPSHANTFSHCKAQLSNNPQVVTNTYEQAL